MDTRTGDSENAGYEDGAVVVDSISDDGLVRRYGAKLQKGMVLKRMLIQGGDSIEMPEVGLAKSKKCLREVKQMLQLNRRACTLPSTILLYEYCDVITHRQPTLSRQASNIIAFAAD